MFLTTTCVMGFKIPDDHKLHENFLAGADVSEWAKTETSQYIYYKKTVTVQSEVENGKD